MTQQSSRYLFKQIQKVKKGKTTKGLFQYLNDMNALATSAAPATDYSSLDGLSQIMKVRAAFHCYQTSALFENSKAGSKSKENELFATDV
jgi:hypothetical protein